MCKDCEYNTYPIPPKCLKCNPKKEQDKKKQGDVMPKFDWNKIRNEYETGNISYRDLVKKYNVSLTALKTRAKNESWVEKKSQTRHKLDTKIVEKTVEKIAEKTSEELSFNEMFVKENLVEVVNRCMQATPVLDRLGEPTGEYRFDSSGANTALLNMAKILKMITDTKHIKQDITQKVQGMKLNFVDEDGNIIDLESMMDDEN